LLLDRIGDQALDLARRGARPLGADCHALESEGRIFRASEIEIRVGAGERRGDDHEQDQRLVGQTPGRQVAAKRRHATHRSGSLQMRTRSDALSLWTPAVTMRSPSLTPAITVTASSA